MAKLISNAFERGFMLFERINEVIDYVIELVFLELIRKTKRIICGLLLSVDQSDPFFSNCM